MEGSIGSHESSYRIRTHQLRGSLDLYLLTQRTLNVDEVFNIFIHSLTLRSYDDDETQKLPFPKAFNKYLAHCNNSTVFSPSHVQFGAYSVINEGSRE